MKFLIYADVHLGRVHPWLRNYHSSYVQEVLAQNGDVKAESIKAQSILEEYLDTLLVINRKAKELAVDHIINLGDTFDLKELLYLSSEHPLYRNVLMSDKPRVEPHEKSFYEYIRKRYNERINEYEKFTKKYSQKFSEIFNGHIVIVGNNDPLEITSSLCGMQYITQPTVFLEEYLLVPYQCGCQAKTDYDIPLNCKDLIKVAFTHDDEDYRRNKFLQHMSVDKIFYGHKHKRKLPKTKKGRFVQVGGFSYYETGFVVYDDFYNIIIEYDSKGFQGLTHQY